MTYDFDVVVPRRGTNSEKWDVAPGELPMWVADMDFPAAPQVLEALRRRLDHGVLGYTGIPDAWYDAYRRWWRTRHGFEIEKDWLVFATGVVPAISSLVRKLTTPAEKVVVMTPVYNIFFNSILNNGRVPLECPLALDEHGYRVDFDALERALADPQATLLLLCNPQNPGGRAWDADTLSRIASLCARHGVLVVSDEIHGDLTDPGTAYVPFASVGETARRISVTCLSPSKAFNLAGLHSAAVVVPEEHLRHRVWRCLNTDEVAEPNAFAIDGAIAAWNEGGPWLDDVRSYLYGNKLLVASAVAQRMRPLRVVPENATYLVWIDCRELPGNGEGFAARLRRETGLYLSDGAQYGAAGRGFVRMNVACPRSVVTEGLRRLERGLAGGVGRNDPE